MADVSGWKKFEREVAEALGGKRQFRTMESYGKVSPDIHWPREMRHKYPILRKVVVECKKRRALNIHAFFSEAKVKYGEKGKIVILASKLPRKGSLSKQIRRMKRKREHFLEAALVKKLQKLEAKGRKLSSRQIERLEERLKRKNAGKIEMAKQKLRARHDISALVTVELGFFAELFKLWLEERGRRDG
jgi:hypothetical protein